jgi:sulfide:quinone oxidoreductase
MVVPPHHAPEVIRSSPLLGVSGFVHVDPSTLQTDYDNVFAIGDVATI